MGRKSSVQGSEHLLSLGGLLLLLLGGLLAELDQVEGGGLGAGGALPDERGGQDLEDARSGAMPLLPHRFQNRVPILKYHDTCSHTRYQNTNLPKTSQSSTVLPRLIPYLQVGATGVAGHGGGGARGAGGRGLGLLGDQLATLLLAARLQDDALAGQRHIDGLAEVGQAGELSTVLVQPASEERRAVRLGSVDRVEGAAASEGPA